MLVAPDDFVLWDFLEARLGRNALHVPDGLTRWLMVMRNEIASSVETAPVSRQSDSGVIDWGARENRDAQTDLSARSSGAKYYGEAEWRPAYVCYHSVIV